MKRLLRKKAKLFSKKAPKLFKRKLARVKNSLSSKIKPVVPPTVSPSGPGGAAPAPFRDTRLPERYDENKLALLVRDPWWLYAYWEVTPQKRGEIEAKIGPADIKKSKAVLRVYDVTGLPHAPSGNFFDIELNFFADNWYIDVGRPDRQWMAELGLRTEDGRFFAWVRSNVVHTPPFGISDVLDEEWMLPDDIYFRVVGPTGLRGGSSSLEIRRIMERFLRAGVSSKIQNRAPVRPDQK